jgi:hypothetical protein
MSKRTNLISLSRSVSSEGVLSSSAIQMGTIVNFPTITAVGYPGNDTAVALAGGDTVTITGTNFKTGAKVVVNGVQPSVVTIVNSTQITFTAPANAAGSYVIYVVNTDGSTALAVPGLQYSGFPAWTTAAGSLGISPKAISFSTTLTATGDAPITYSLASGTIPPGLTLNPTTGVLSGTTPTVNADTTYSFTIRSTDPQNQDTDRTFSLTVLYTNPTPTASYVIVGGGGGGGGAGGGGGGGVKTGTFSPVIGNQYTVTVAQSVASATSGNSSVFNAVTAGGGGAGGTPSGGGSNGSNGGSGGGASYYTGGASPSGASGGSGSTSGGNSVYQSGSYLSPGGSYVNYTAAAGGGGGGAAGAGGSASVTTVTDNFGRLNGYNAGGGYGGSGSNYSSWGIGTVSGGGGPNGAAGGSGSGSGSYGGGGSSGLGGGPGVVVIRYADNYDVAYATTGSPTVTVSGGFRTYTFTSSGSITF